MGSPERTPHRRWLVRVRPANHDARPRAHATLPTLRFAEPIRDMIVKATELTAESKPKTLEGLRVQFKFAAKKESKEDRNVVGLFPGIRHRQGQGSRHLQRPLRPRRGRRKGRDLQRIRRQCLGDQRTARDRRGLWRRPAAGPQRGVPLGLGRGKGPVGSQWFSDHVSLPADYKIVADINLDMVSRNDAKSIGITPSDKHADYSTLIPAARAAAKEEGLTTKFNADGFYRRTDSYNFARKGIPVIFFFCGVHADYHRPTDDFTKADFEKAARVARAAYRLGWQVAQDKDVPKKIKADETKTADSR